MSRPVVYVHTNNSQLLPALVGIHSLRTRAGGSEAFDTRLLRLEGSALDARRDGQTYRARGEAVWNHTHPSAFHYLRRRVPEFMAYRGRALVIDPDVFAVGSLVPLLERDMEGKALLCRYMSDGFQHDGTPIFSTGVMLLDCSKLTHWRWRDEIDDLFNRRLDYWDMLQLVDEAPETIGELGESWNSLDALDSSTRLL